MRKQSFLFLFHFGWVDNLVVQASFNTNKTLQVCVCIYNRIVG